MIIMKYVSQLINVAYKVFRRVIMHIFKSRFKLCGKNVIFNPFDSFTYENIILGNDVSISSGAHFSCTHTFICIGNKVMFGPNVTIIAGDHNTNEVGKYMIDIHNKLPENDLPVLIENDVWVGAGVIILKGVKIGAGSIVAAGALVKQDVAPYSIVAGVPARLLKMRFSPEVIDVHEKTLLINNQI